MGNPSIRDISGAGPDEALQLAHVRRSERTIRRDEILFLIRVAGRNGESLFESGSKNTEF